MSTDIQVSNPKMQLIPSGDDWQARKEIARDLIRSGALPADTNTAEKALVKMQAGFEAGLPPLKAITSMYIVNGQVNFWGAAMIERLLEHGYHHEFVDEDYSVEGKETCTVKVWHKDDKKRIFTETFTFEEATKSIHMKDRNNNWKPGWKPGINRKKKLRYGAVSLVINTYLPHTLGAASGMVWYAESGENPTDYIEIDEDQEKQEQESKNEKTTVASARMFTEQLKKEKLEEEKKKAQEEQEEEKEEAQEEPNEEQPEEAGQPDESDEPKETKKNNIKQVSPERQKAQEKYLSLAQEFGIEEEEAKSKAVDFVKKKTGLGIQTFDEVQNWYLATLSKGLESKIKKQSTQQEFDTGDANQ